MREAMSGEGTEIAEAGSFDAASKTLENDPSFDLVLLDLTMPGVSGFSGLMYLRAQYPALPVVVVSANEDPTTIRRCMDFGASGFIPKTLGVEEMRGALRAALVPQIETTKAVGIVFLPGAMTGLILAGVAPLDAVLVQVVVMYLVLGATATSTAVVAEGLTRRLFTADHRMVRLTRPAD